MYIWTIVLKSFPNPAPGWLQSMLNLNDFYFFSLVLDVHAFERLLGPCMDIMKRSIDGYEEQLKKLGIGHTELRWNCSKETVILELFKDGLFLDKRNIYRFFSRYTFAKNEFAERENYLYIRFVPLRIYKYS